MTDSPLSNQLRYFGPEHHADWCVVEPTHSGACLDEILRRIDAMVVDDRSDRDGGGGGGT